MKTAVLAALAAAFALPVFAQGTAPRTEQPTPSVATPASAKPAEKAATPRETARVAKARNQEVRCATKPKQPRQKKATAT